MVENVITSKLEIQGYENIKQIKDEITKLRAQMKELTSGTEEYKETADKLVQTEYQLKTAMSNARKDNSALKGSYNDLANQMSALKKVWKETTDEAVRADYGQQINELNTQLKALDATTGNFQRNVGDYKNQLKLAKQELAQLTQGTDAYNQKLAECAEIAHNMKEQQTLIKNSSKDLGDQLDNVVKIGSGMASGFAALNAAMGLFGKDTEDAQKALLKVQQTMALVQGLQGLEGMWKKCEQLSTALGLVRATTVQVTTATVAEGAAMKGAAVAEGAQAVATETATVAQKGLNAAMKANPIGLIITAITTIIGLFTLFGDKLKNLIKSNDEFSDKLDKLKTILSGVGSVIKKWIVLPIQNTIDILKIFGKVIGDVFTGKWGKIKDDLKEGATEIKNSIKDALDVKGTYAQAAADKAEEIEREKRKKLAEIRSKELDDFIKNVEAQKGSEYKYTEQGIKKYREYYKAKMDMYDKDTEEFKQAQRDMWSYEKALSDRDSANKKKLAEEQKKQQETIQKSWESMMQNLVSTTFQTTKKEIDDFVKLWNDFVKSTGQGKKINLIDGDELTDLDSAYEILSKYITGEVTTMSDDLREKFIGALQSKAINALVKNEQEMLVKIDNNYKEFYNREKTRYEYQAVHKRKTMEEELEFEKTLTKERTDAYALQWNKILGLQNEILDSTRSSKDAVRIRKELDEIFGPITKIYLDQMDVAYTEYYKRRSEIRLKYLNDEIESTKNYVADQKNMNQMVYDMYESQSSVWGDDSLKVFKVYREMVDENYQYEVEGIENIIKNLENALSSNLLTAEDYQTTLDQLRNAQMEKDDIELQHQIEVNRLKKEDFIRTYDAIQSSINATSDVLGNFGNYYADIIDSSVKLGDKTEEEAEKEYEVVKGIQTAQAIINTIGAAMGAFNAMASIPLIGPALGAAAAASTLAMGYAQVQQIRATNPYSNSSSNDNFGSGNSTISTPTIPDYSPNRVTNITGAMETENLANAMRSTPLWVSVTDVDRVQTQVKVKESETTF